MFEQQRIMNTLVDKPPSAWLDYLRPFEDGHTVSGLSMDGIFHFAVVRITSTDEGLAWAEVAVRALDIEALQGGDDTPAMKLRARLIAENGARDGHIVLDKARVIDWVNKKLTIPVHVAAGRCAALREQWCEPGKKSQSFMEDLKMLREIKHRLIAAQSLDEGGELPEDSSLVPWLKIRNELP